MRTWTFLLCLLMLSGVVLAQKKIPKKYLISPNQEILPVDDGKSAEQIMSEYLEMKHLQTYDCSQPLQFGADPVHNPPDGTFNYTHRTILGQWYVAPADGRIDTMYWLQAGTVQTGLNPQTASDSTAVLRIFKSFITPLQGPGIRNDPNHPGGYPPPCRSWGYYLSTADPDQGIAAFPEDASGPDTSWHSTIEFNGGLNASFPPFGKAIWGLSGVPAQHIKPNAINKFALVDVQDFIVSKGDVFFATMKPSSPVNHPDAAHELSLVFRSSSSNSSYPSRDWKFYEHDSGPGPSCSGTPRTEIKKGWVARGTTGDDTLATLLYNVWFSLAPTTNVAPNLDYTQLHNTTNTGPVTFSASLVDCDKEVPARAGVDHAYLKYAVKTKTETDYEPELSTPLNFIFGDEWDGAIPGQAAGTTVKYRLFAFDSTGLGDSTGAFTYRVIGLNSNYYRCDTGFACTPASIHSAPAIGASDWFVDSARAGTGSHRGDDGTAGPFSLGGPFVYYGDTVNYAWIGVNGAMALTKSATDTDDVNLNGFATGGWDLPNRQH
ncbi:MAG: hypothetical protein HYR77_04525, partial [Ignavibacteria bacterium]|nr:hypothetical protein [Ignavibacteria bacterium]